MTLKLFDVFLEFFYHIRLSFFAVIVAMWGLHLWPVEFQDSHIFWCVGSEAFDAGTFFHFFHYPHITFAAATCFVTVFRYARCYWLALCISFFFPTILCTLSDILLPYLGGLMFGVPMDLHICLFCNTLVALCFLLAGILGGFLFCFFDKGGSFLFSVSLLTHFLHEFVSAIASLVYMIGFGFYTWQNHLISVLFLMLFAVVVPCVLSDFLIPLLAVRLFKRGVVSDVFCSHQRDLDEKC